MNRRSFNKNLIILSMGVLAKDALASAMSQESKKRTIYKVIDARASGMGQMALKNIIEGNYQNYVSPFFLLDEFGPMQLAAGAPFRVDAHPHAGIIPTTFLLQGNAHHRDSMGNDFEYTAGDFIQFTSGKGALHMEETGNELFEQGGVFHGFQGWLNLPPHLKKSEPNASHISKDKIGIVEKDNAKIHVVLGEVFGVKSSANLLIPVIYWHVEMNENALLEFPIDKELNAFVYVQEGQVEVNETHTGEVGQTVLFERDGDVILIKAKSKSVVMVLGGEVNNAPYVASGPFVLNNEQEIAQAYADFHLGKFGDLEKTNGQKRKY